MYCLLTVQIEYPESVHLIRGNHEAADINALFGFRIECIERMVGMNTLAVIQFMGSTLQFILFL